VPITVITIVGRSLLALLFILAGAAKVAGPQPFLDHMAAHHMPGVLLPLVILLELGAGTALLLGWRLPFAAGALALFCFATAFVFQSRSDRQGRANAFRQGPRDCGCADGYRGRRVATPRCHINRMIVAHLRVRGLSRPGSVADRVAGRPR